MGATNNSVRSSSGVGRPPMLQADDSVQTSADLLARQRVAVLVPCYNEEAAIGKVVQDRLDMVCAVRIDREEAAYRLGHRFGNRLLTGFVAHVFGQSFSDML